MAGRNQVKASYPVPHSVPQLIPKDCRRSVDYADGMTAKGKTSGGSGPPGGDGDGEYGWDDADYDEEDEEEEVEREEDYRGDDVGEHYLAPTPRGRRPETTRPQHGRSTDLQQRPTSRHRRGYDDSESDDSTSF